jgi:hypothetical protein
MLLYTLTKKFMEVQRNMLNACDIILFYKVVGWFDGQDNSVEPLPTYTMWNMYIHKYTLYMYVNI